jgi:hypothetical protein
MFAAVTLVGYVPGKNPCESIPGVGSVGVGAAIASTLAKTTIEKEMQAHPLLRKTVITMLSLQICAPTTPIQSTNEATPLTTDLV